MSKKAVLFDLDDTLYNYTAANKVALVEVHKVFIKHVNVGYDEFIRLYELAKEEIHRELSGTASAHNRILHFQRIIEKTHNTFVSEIILELYDTYWDTILHQMKLNEGAWELLVELKKRNIKTAIISDLTTRIQLRKISQLRITDYIDVLVTSEGAGAEKPHPIMFLMALNKLNLLPQDAIMVGDNPINDIEGGNAVGIDTVQLITKEKGLVFSEKDYMKPKYTIGRLLEILEILEKNNKTL